MLGSIGSTNLLSSIQSSQTKMLSLFQQLSSGSAINSAADNPAGSAQSADYTVQLSSAAKAIAGLDNSQSLLNTAGGGIGQISDGIQQMSELAVQAGNGSLNANDLDAIQSQISQLGQGIDQTARNTQFNGQNLLDGSSTNSYGLKNLSSASLGLSGIDVTTASGQSSATAALSSALDLSNSQQSQVGSSSAGVAAEISNLTDSYTNLAAANSRVSDADIAHVASQLAQTNVQQQASMKALAIYNQVQKNSLNLISNIA